MACRQQTHRCRGPRPLHLGYLSALFALVSIGLAAAVPSRGELSRGELRRPFGRRLLQACPAAPFKNDFITYNDMYYGSSLALKTITGSVDDCKKSCLADCRCGGFVYRTLTKTCYTKGKLTSNHRSVGRVTYFRSGGDKPGGATGGASSPPPPPNSPPPAGGGEGGKRGAGKAVWTSQYNNARTNAQLEEKALNLAKLTVNNFGRLAKIRVDGQIWGQPLYVPAVATSKGTRNLVFAATQTNAVYAFDADTFEQIWHLPGDGGVPSGGNNPVKCGDVTPTTGITGTPVIDLNSKTLYAVGYYKGQVYKMLALDIATGAHKRNSPATISATSQGLRFNPKTQRQRTALALDNGALFFGFGSFCDYDIYYGWVMAVDAGTLAVTASWVATSTCPTAMGGIWMGGGAAAVNGKGQMYFTTGNGCVDPAKGNYGNSILKLSTAPGDRLKIAQYFVPTIPPGGDTDLGSGGVLIMSDQGGEFLSQVGKSGIMYILDGNNMGGHNNCAGNGCPNRDAHARQVVSLAGDNNIQPSMGTGCYWTPKDRAVSYLYQGNKSGLKMYQVRGGLLTTKAPFQQYDDGLQYSKLQPSISTDGSSANAILWAVNGNSVLVAYNPFTLQPVWTSNMMAQRDGMAGNPKYTRLIVVNGRVYVGGRDGFIHVYGLFKE